MSCAAVVMTARAASSEDATASRSPASINAFNPLWRLMEVELTHLRRSSVSDTQKF